MLKNKHLSFKSENSARKILFSIGYYKLINAYKIPFMKYENGNHVFMDGVDFEDIYNLYLFDRKLKTIVFEASTNVEINFKSLLSDLISSKYGIKDTKYLKKENFEPDKGILNEYTFSNMKKHIRNEIKKQYDNAQPSIKWYGDNYGYYPFWVVVNILTIGSVSRIYGKLKKIKSEFSLVLKGFSLFLYFD